MERRKENKTSKEKLDLERRWLIYRKLISQKENAQTNDENRYNAQIVLFCISQKSPSTSRELMFVWSHFNVLHLKFDKKYCIRNVKKAGSQQNKSACWIDESKVAISLSFHADNILLSCVWSLCIIKSTIYIHLQPVRVKCDKTSLSLFKINFNVWYWMCANLDVCM